MSGVWYVDQRSCWNPLLNIAARVTGRHYFWYCDSDGARRRLWFGRA